MNSSIDLRRLQHLVILAEELNFSRAAERACLSQTAFSRSIQTLETEFGLRLFDRDSRSVRATAMGAHLILRARELLARAGELTLEVAELTNAGGGVLSFGATLFAVNTVLKGVLPRLTQGRPRLRINLDVGRWQTLAQHLEDEMIELFIGYPGHLKGDARFVLTMLAGCHGSVYCRANHPLLADPQRDQVAHYPWAMVQMDNHRRNQLRALFGIAPSDEVPLALCCDNLELLRESTLASDTLLFTWHTWVQADLASDVLVDVGKRLQPTISPQQTQVECAIVRRTGRSLSPAAQRLIELVLH